MKNPFGLIKRAFYKLFIGPLKYGRGRDYDAGRYWQDRLTKYGDSLRGPGDEGKSEDDNIKDYARDEQIFTDMVKGQGLDLKQVAALDIGCGTGFYTEILKRLGVKDYTGIDITDALFAKLKERFPAFQFIKKDFASEQHEGQYQLIIMIEVLEHIVSDEKLDFAMENVKRCLADDGVFLISSLWPSGGRHMFYVRKWTVGALRSRFAEYHFGEPIPFRGSLMTTIRRK